MCLGPLPVASVVCGRGRTGGVVVACNSSTEVRGAVAEVQPVNEQPGFEVAIGPYRFDPADEEPPPEDIPAADDGRVRPWIVQFHRVPGEGDIARLRAQYGLRLGTHIPELAYLERLDSETAGRVRADPVTRACVPYRPEFKLSPSIPALTGPTRLRAVLFDDADPDRVSAQLDDAGASDLRVSDRREMRGHARIRFMLEDPEQLDVVAELDEVRRIEPVGRIVNRNVAGASTTQGGAPDHATIWDRGLHGEGQIVGIIDDGPPDIEHCFFADPSNNTPGPNHRKVLAIRNAAKTPVTGGGDEDDEDEEDDEDDGESGDRDEERTHRRPGHATFVAGCIVGDDHRAPGASPQRGGAWAAKLVCGNTHDKNWFDDEFFASAKEGAYIHSNSIASVPPPNHVIGHLAYDENSFDVDNFTWSNEAHLVIGASANTGQMPGPPGTAKNAICVAAANAHPGHADLCNGFPGPTLDGRRKPDLVVVGEVESALSETPCDTGPQGCATSWATAHAAAAAALVGQYFEEGWYPTGKANPNHARIPTGALLKAVLLNATVPMAGTDFAGEYPTHSEGWGRLQLDRALYFDGGARKLQVWDRRNVKGLKTGDTRTHRVEVKGSSEPLRVTLVWTEPPGEDPGDPVVNDLDLRVISAGDANEYRGNAFLDGESDPTSRFRDARNNVEMVLVKVPATGKWTIEVRAIKVVVGDPGQGYALVVTGDISPECFVGTAVYGDPDHPDVALLREWRDKRLAPGIRGRTAMRVLVAAYERLGPRLAHIVGGWPRLTAFLRRFVFAPVVAVLRRHDPASADLGLGRRRPC
jgi:hypothetical protein